MCGRYYVDDETAREIERLVRNLDRRFRMQASDIRPSRPAPVLRVDTEGRGPGLEEMYWGFPVSGRSGLLINARAESVLDRKIFRDSVLHRRCIIPARGFYEWNKRREKYQFERYDGKPVLMAGFYNLYQEKERFVILTTEANASVRPVHERMPLVLEESEVENWLLDDKAAKACLQKVPAALEHRAEYEQMTLF